MPKITNQWVFVRKSDRTGYGWYRCSCPARTEREQRNHDVTSGHTKSCGCQMAQSVSIRLTKHGHTHKGKKSTEYRTWRSMYGRCHNPRHMYYHNYGGRGITVCERWRDSFAVFLADMGLKPSTKHSIDRIDNDKGYEPGNCRWATRKQQARNSRTARIISYAGRSQCVAAWAEELKIPCYILNGRLARGWSDADVVSRPIRGRR